MTNLLKKALLLASIAIAQAASAQTPADGLAAIHLGEWDKAINIYTALSKANPSDQSLLLSLGNAYVAKGDNAKAAEIFQKAFEANTDGTLALVALARQALMKNDIAETEKLLDKAKRKGRKDIVAHRHIGETFIFYVAPGSKKPNFTRAEELLKAAIDVNNKDFETVMSMAYLYKAIPDGGKAAQFYEQAEYLEQKNPLPKLMMGKVYKSAKVPDKPLLYFNKAIALQPNYSPALRAKAEMLYFARKWEEATVALKDLVKNGSEVTIEDEMLLANSLYVTKDCKSCSELVEKILAKDGSKNYLRRLQAYCDYDNGDYTRGLQILNEYFKIVKPEKMLPSDFKYHGDLLLKTKGDTLQAIADYRKAIEMDTIGTDSWKLYQDIAELQYFRRDMCGSAISYGKLLDSLPGDDPNRLTYYYYKGVGHYYCKGDSMSIVKAEKDFKKITEIKPDAMIGWEWAAKSASQLDPSPAAIEADPTKAKEYGKARYYHEKIIEIFGSDMAKKQDLIKSSNYLAYYYFVQKDEANFNKFVAKWLELETDPAKVTTINEMKEAFGKEEEPVTPDNKPKTPVNGGGGKG